MNLEEFYYHYNNNYVLVEVQFENIIICTIWIGRNFIITIIIIIYDKQGHYSRV